MKAIFLIFIFLVAYYIMRAIALYRFFKTAGYSHPWMAWMPYLNLYAIGDFTSHRCGENGKVSMFGAIPIPAGLCRYWFVIYFILNMTLESMGMAGSLITLAVTLFFTAGTLSVLMAEMKGTDTEQEIWHSMAASIIPFVDVAYFTGVRRRLGKQDTEQSENNQ